MVSNQQHKKLFSSIHVVVSFYVINTKASWMIDKSSSCTDPSISLYDSSIINQLRSVIEQNFYTEEYKFNFSTHISPYLEKYGVFFSCGIWWKSSVSRVKFPVHVHKFGRSLELAPWATHMIKHTSVNQQWCECSSHSFSLLPDFLLPWVYLQIHRVISCLFLSFQPMVMRTK